MNWSGNFREGLAREIRENKTLAKITAYTVYHSRHHCQRIHVGPSYQISRKEKIMTIFFLFLYKAYFLLKCDINEVNFHFIIHAILTCKLSQEIFTIRQRVKPICFNKQNTYWSWPPVETAAWVGCQGGAWSWGWWWWVSPSHGLYLLHCGASVAELGEDKTW